MTILQAIEAYLQTVSLARSANTARTYTNALAAFAHVLAEKNLPPAETPIETLTEDAAGWFIAAAKDYAPATEQLYLSAVNGFYEYVASEKLAAINLPRLRLMARMRARKPGLRLPQFPREAIEKTLDYAQTLLNLPSENPQERLRALRDRAFLLTLADTGLRVHEACRLRRGDMDWNEGRAVVIIKGNREEIVRFSTRSMAAIKDYLAERASLDGGSGRPLGALPLFARHDKGAGKKVKSITTATGRNIVAERVAQALGAAAAGTITPHSFRHYFVTTVLLGSGGNLKLAQELARHRSITVTQRYAHLSNDELDRGYLEIFEDETKSESKIEDRKS